jgi:hypothetical protein
MTYARKDLQGASLAVLVHRINQQQDILDGYTRNTLRVAMDQGDVLAQAKATVGARQWKPFREENCPRVAKRTDELHRRLAAHRARLEQELAVNPDLGVAEAAALISAPKKPKKTTAAPAPTRAFVPATAASSAKPVPVAPAPTAPMRDADRAAVIDLALEALTVTRRPVSAPNNERVQALLSQIVRAAKTVTQAPKPMALDTALFPKAIGVAA